MQYTILYDAVGQGVNLAEALPPLAFIIMGIGMLVGRRYGLAPGVVPTTSYFAAVFPWLFMLFACGFEVIEFETALAAREDAEILLRSGGARTIEGPVERHDVTRDGRRFDEDFTVAGVSFHTSSHQRGPGYRMRSAGAVLRDGMLVRIRYVGGKILRLEVDAREGLRPTQDPPEWLGIGFLAVAFGLLGATIWAVARQRSTSAALLPPGSAYAGQSLRTGFFKTYNGCVNVSVGDHGIAWVLQPPFRLAPKIQNVSWTEIEDASKEAASPFLLSAIVRTHSGKKLVFYGDCAAEIRRQAVERLRP